jgi:hypothetical protein
VFQGWDSFFQITGEAAATLTGLIFVVATLTQGSDRARLLRAVSIYLTPTVLHFAIVLSISALAVAPRLYSGWRAALFALAALTGFGNGLWSCIGMSRRQPGADTPPHWSDLWLYGVAPTALYALLLADTVAVGARTPWAVNVLAILLLALLLLGIRNAWDLITWMASSRNAAAAPELSSPSGGGGPRSGGGGDLATPRPMSPLPGFAGLPPEAEER